MLPEGWSHTTINETIKVGRGFAFKSEQYRQDGIKILRVTNIEPDGSILSEGNWKYIDIDEENTYSRFKLREYDIIIVMVGATTGKLGFVKNHNLPALLNQNMWSLRTKDKNNLDQIFFSHLCPIVVENFLSTMQGSARGFLTQGDFSKHKFSFPPLPEQKKIADILSTWDAAIETTGKLLANAEAQKRALMQQLLTGKQRHSNNNSDMKHEVRLGDVVAIDQNSLGQKTDKDFEFDYISLSNVEPGRIVGPLQRLRYADAPSRARRIIQDGDIIVSTVRPNLKGFARVTAKEADCIVSTGFSVISPSSKTDGSYLFHYLFSQHMTEQLDALVVGSNYPAINSKDVRGLKVGLPELSAQRRIGAILDVCEQEINGLAKQASILQTEKRALMQQLLTGKRRVAV
jgi:type I restriction enzyme S subunit